jgi:hypothetical protein
VRRAPEHAAPADAAARRAVPPVICYPTEALPAPDLAAYRAARAGWTRVSAVEAAPRTACVFEAPAGSFVRIACPEGPQVGDLNLWNADDLGERFFSGKTRALHGSHVSTGDRLWSCLPYLRPMATITEDTLDWYGVDGFGAGVHDVIGTRCDPYTAQLLTGRAYDRCCHSNLSRAVAARLGVDAATAEAHVHDVLNVFMCTGFEAGTGRYFMKASPARAGDFLEFFAEIDLLGALSACPGGDCGATHSSDDARCLPLRVEVFRPAAPPAGWTPPTRGRSSAAGPEAG